MPAPAMPYVILPFEDLQPVRLGVAATAWARLAVLECAAVPPSAAATAAAQRTASANAAAFLEIVMNAPSFTRLTCRSTLDHFLCGAGRPRERSVA